MADERKIYELMRLKSPAVYIPKIPLEDSGPDPTRLFGLELEIEGLDSNVEYRQQRCVSGVDYHEDGSLRNNGGEYVTRPMRRTHLLHVLETFFKKNVLSEENYSERTSVHVHVNCQDLTQSQLRLVLCLYQIMERVLFKFIKEERAQNIFCVPWSECLLHSQAFSDLDSILAQARYWKKYTALNLIPLSSFGTIEFRHMSGTNDLKRIITWVDIIGSLFRYATTHEYDDVIKDFLALNTSSAYDNFMERVFSREIYDTLAVGEYKSLLEEGIIGMKVMLHSPNKEEKKRKSAMTFAEAVAPRWEPGDFADDIPEVIPAFNPNPWDNNVALAELLREHNNHVQGQPQPIIPPPRPRVNVVNDQGNEALQRQVRLQELARRARGTI